MGEVGYRYLSPVEYPGRKFRAAEELEFVPSLGTPAVSSKLFGPLDPTDNATPIPFRL
ncbi:MAG: hypothetical protein OXF79_03000 [Chloroflexi bacterium]|nr:hypothetical protein [Chloroflexota bacterium]